MPAQTPTNENKPAKKYELTADKRGITIPFLKGKLSCDTFFSFIKLKSKFMISLKYIMPMYAAIP